MFSGMLVSSLFSYAMSGNIRGNGHYNASRRLKERDQFGYEPKTINIGGKWISYKGIIGVDQMLSTLGDLAYYSNDLNEAMLENWQAKLSWTLSAGFLNETPLASIEPLVAIVNGDLSGFNRLIAQMARASIPLSSALGVLTNAIESAQKDIDGEIIEYLMNRLPGLKNMLPDQIDIWTGRALNDIDNPWLKILNAINPFQVSSDYPDDLYEMYKGKKVLARDVIKWLQNDLNFAGLSKLNMDSTGSYQYSTQEREIINRKMGSYEMWRDIVPIMMNPEYADQLKKLRAHRHTNADLNNEDIAIKLKLLPVYKHVSKVVEFYQKKAEKELQIGGDMILDQEYTDDYMEKGMVDKAIELQKKNKETQQLLQYNNN